MAALPSRSVARQAASRPRALLVLAVVLAAQGCMPSGQESGSGPGHRRQVLGLTPEQEYDLGQKAYRKILDWQFNVLRSREVNAFCLPGGRVVVYTSLLRIVENDDQLATVLSHEIAHALAHHANERITTEESGRVNWLFRQAYDRQQESEADHIGLFLMTFAGYDPDEVLTFWQHMERLSHGGQLPEILSNHPSDRRRIEQIRKWVPQAKAAKEAYEHHRIAPAR